MSNTKAVMAPAIVAQSQALAVIPDKEVMEAAPTKANMAVLKSMSEEGLISPEIQAAAVMLYLAVDPKSLKDLKIIHLIDAAKMVVNDGMKLGDDFYLVPKLGPYVSKRGLQRKLGKAGLPPPEITSRRMTEEERHNHGLKDAEELGSVVTMRWPSLGITVTGIGTVDVEKLYGNSRLQWSQQGQPPKIKPRSEWKLQSPPEGRTWEWVCEKRAERDCLNKMDGFKFVTPQERVDAGRSLGLPMIGQQFDGTINTAQAKAAIDSAVAMAAMSYSDAQVRDILGEAAYAKLVAGRLEYNQKRMYGSGPDPFDQVDSAPVAEIAPPAPADDKDEDFDEIAGDAVTLAADHDLLLDLQEAQAELLSGHPEYAEPATANMVELWTQRCKEAIAGASEHNDTGGVLLVTARLCGVLPETAMQDDFAPSQAQVRSWMRAWLVPSKPFALKQGAAESILAVHGEAVKDLNASFESETD